MNLGQLRMAVALTSTLEGLPDETGVNIEFGILGNVSTVRIKEPLGHMRSEADGKSVTLSIFDEPPDAG